MTSTTFDYKVETLVTQGLRLDYYLVPWDSKIFASPVAEICHLEVIDIESALRDFDIFNRWRETEKIQLCHSRIQHDQLTASMLLESHGFRFIEMNYRPLLGDLQSREIPSNDFVIEKAQDNDMTLLADMAETIFHSGRFHQDYRLGEALGNKRYRVWLESSFNQSHQTTLKCLHNGSMIGFLVAESPQAGHSFWSLIGLAPGLQGLGYGKKMWLALLLWYQQQGFDTVSTSISSHNLAVFNLYISLGFRFPQPSMSFHWVSDDHKLVQV